MTPRELAAHRKLFEDKQKQFAFTFAELQATLHNAWFKRKDESEAPFTRDEFLPEAIRPPRRLKSWQEQMAAFQQFAAAQGDKTG